MVSTARQTSSTVVSRRVLMSTTYRRKYIIHLARYASETNSPSVSMSNRVSDQTAEPPPIAANTRAVIAMRSRNSDRQERIIAPWLLPKLAAGLER